MNHVFFPCTLDEIIARPKTLQIHKGSPEVVSEFLFLKNFPIINIPQFGANKPYWCRLTRSFRTRRSGRSTTSTASRVFFPRTKAPPPQGWGSSWVPVVPPPQPRNSLAPPSTGRRVVSPPLSIQQPIWAPAGLPPFGTC